jgi:transposase
MESLVPSDHPLRRVKPLADEALRELSPIFDAMYSSVGRPSIPPEHLLKASLLMALYSVRSERLFCEQLGYNMLYRWFLDMEMVDRPFDPTVFSHNRERMLGQDVAGRFLATVVEGARRRGLLSSEHFSVDGTLIEAAASFKSFKPKGEAYDSKSFADFHGDVRKNDTHESKTDPEAKLYRKSGGTAAKLSYMGHVLIENRHGLAVDFDVSQATGTAERDTALTLVERARAAREDRRKRKQQRKQKKRGKRRHRITLAADKGYDTKDFVRDCRERDITPHVARKDTTIVDGRTTRHVGYRLSQTKRLLTEKVFGWGKTIGGFRRTPFIGLQRTRAAAVMVVAAYDLLRIANILAA